MLPYLAMAPHAEESSAFIMPTTKSIPKLEAVTDTSATAVPDPVTQLQPTITRFRHNDVLPSRETCSPMKVAVAAFSSADLFKSEGAKSKPKASKSFYDSHLNAEAKARKSSSLKGAMKYFTPETISLCGGLPSSEYFPFEELAYNVPTAPEFEPSQTMTLRCGKNDTTEKRSVFDLSIALNYGQSMGPPQLMRYLTEHTEIVHNPQYSDWDICLTQGSTSALDIALRMFCSRGDAVLFEEYSFSSAIESALPMGLQPVGIKMDAKGMCAKDLEHVLSNWETLKHKFHGAARPKMLYTVPTGQNPTGATQDEQRRRDILAVCEKYNVFILEDEPYYFLQMEEYVSKRHQTNGTHGHTEQPSATDDLSTFIDALVPSYLHLARSGNVLRLDSFSKILAPGTRTGWVTGPSNIVERFIRASEVSAQTPSGFSMVALFKLLEEGWGHEGFLRWLQHLRKEYSARRDGIVSACEEYLPTEYVQFDAPMAGMFHWLRVDASKHPVWKEKSKSLNTESEKRALLIELEEKIFQHAAEKHVLIARGSWFRAEKGNSVDEKLASGNGYTEVKEEVDETMYFRMTFAAAPQDKIAEAVRRFGETLREEFESS